MFDYFHYFASQPNQPDPAEILELEHIDCDDLFTQDEIDQAVKAMHQQAVQYEKPVGLRIIVDGKTLHESLQGDLGEPSLDWLKRKERVVNETGHSSYYIFLDNITSHQYDYMIDDEGYGICGGSFPLIVDHSIRGTITCTGLRPQEDHDVVMAGLKVLYG